MKTAMNTRLRCCCLFLTITLFSCSKTGQTPSSSTYYGKWQFIGWSFGPSYHSPSADSIVVLTLNPGNNYTTTLNGQISLEGSFTIDSNANGAKLTFPNIDKPYGSATTVVINGTTFLYFNTAKIGQLTLFQNNAASLSGDSLELISSPITPSPTINLFKRIQ